MSDIKRRSYRRTNPIETCQCGGRMLVKRTWIGTAGFRREDPNIVNRLVVCAECGHRDHERDFVPKPTPEGNK